MALCLISCKSAESESVYDGPDIVATDVIAGQGNDVGSGLPTGPDHYFMAIHCDPAVAFPAAFIGLEKMVAEATERGLVLTLMFTPQWVPEINDVPDRKALMEQWKAEGHEIALHHHSVYHPGTWDQYSDFDYEEYASIMGPLKADKLQKLGSLNDLITELDSFEPGMGAGCSNAEIDKSVMPDTILIDSCSGFSNSYAHPVGTRIDGAHPLQGVNDFVMSGTTSNGIQRQWIGHALITPPFFEQTAQGFYEMNGGAHGVVTHTNEQDLSNLIQWMDLAISHDGGVGSKTLSQIVSGGYLPVETVNPVALNTIYLD